MRGWLAGCQLKNQVFPLGKVLVPQTVVWYNFFVNLLVAGKNNSGKNKDCVGFYSPLRAEAEYGFSVFITTKAEAVYGFSDFITTCFTFFLYYDDDCFYYHSWRNNVVIAFGTLSSFLT